MKVSSKTKTRLNIFEFHDYREYLKSQLAAWKKVKGGLSLRKVAETCDVSAPFLSMVLSAHKAMPEKLELHLTRLLGLTEDEGGYFKLLRLMADGEDAKIRLSALEEVQKFRDYRQLNPKETEVFRYLSKWYYVAIRELAALPGFTLDPHWIQKQLTFEVPVKEIEKAVEFLQSHGFLKLGDDGVVKQVTRNVMCEGGVYRIALGQYYRQIFGLAADSIDRVERDRRYLRGDTLAIPESQLNEFKQIIDEAFNKIVSLKRKRKETDSVYHIGFFGFPLALKSKKDESK
ncbi:MAG: DUF4423 domain-containing protein [Bdellovibrionia bacterium]